MKNVNVFWHKNLKSFTFNQYLHRAKMFSLITRSHTTCVGSFLFLFAVTRFTEKATMALLWNLNSNKTVTCFDATGFVFSTFSCLKERLIEAPCKLCCWVLLIQQLTHFLFLQLPCALAWHNWPMNRTAPLPHSDLSGTASVPVHCVVVFEQRSVGKFCHENYKYSKPLIERGRKCRPGTFATVPPGAWSSKTKTCAFCQRCIIFYEFNGIMQGPQTLT